MHCKKKKKRGVWIYSLKKRLPFLRETRIAMFLSTLKVLRSLAVQNFFFVCNR